MDLVTKSAGSLVQAQALRHYLAPIIFNVYLSSWPWLMAGLFQPPFQGRKTLFQPLVSYSEADSSHFLLLWGTLGGPLLCYRKQIPGYLLSTYHLLTGGSATLA